MTARLAAALCMAALLAACTTPQPATGIIPDDAPAVIARPALYDLSDVASQTSADVPQVWVLEKNGQTLSLFGTMHATPAGFRWLSPAAKRALAEADLVLTEVGTTDAAQYNPRESEAEALLPLVMREDGLDTRDMVAVPGSPARLELETALDLAGITAVGAARSRPWALCLDMQRGERPDAVRRLSAEARDLRLAAAKALGPIDPDSPDARIERFRLSQGLAHQQLETFATRARIYATMSDEEAIQCIRARAQQMATGADLKDLPARYALAFSQWRSGDTEGARQTETALSMAIAPAFAARLYQAREVEWLAQIAGRCEAARLNCLVAVGFAHLGGADGLLKSLERRGWTRAKEGM